MSTSLDRYKKELTKSGKEKFTEKHTNVGKNNRLGEILEYMGASDGWVTIKTLSEKFGWSEQESARKLSYYVNKGFMRVSERIKTSHRPLSVYVMTDEGAEVLGRYLARHGGC